MADALSLPTLWQQQYDKYQRSRKRIADAGMMRRGEVPPHVPLGWEAPDSFRLYLPHAARIGQQIISYASRRAPGVRRPAGPGPMAERTASKIERWIGRPAAGVSPGGGALGELRANGETLWEAFLAHAANDGEWATLVVPRTAHWSGLLDFDIPDPENPGSYLVHPYFLRDDDNNGIEPDELEDLLESQQYPRDFAMNVDRSSAAYYKYAREQKARRLPFVVDVLHPDVCIPTGIDPATGKVDVLLVREERTAISLKSAGFSFTAEGYPDSQQGWAGTSYSSALRGVGTRYVLYSLWLPGKVLYQIAETRVGGKDERALQTAYNGQYSADSPAMAEVDLEGEFGICDVPGGYFYGAHHPDERDPDKKGYPFIYHLLGLIRGANQLMTNVAGHSFKWGFGGYLIDASKVPMEMWQTLGKADTFDLVPNQARYVFGTPVPVVHPGASPEIDRLVQTILGLLATASPTGLTGNPDQAGFAQAVAAAGGEVEIGQVIGGATLALKRTAECLLEQASRISELIGGPVPVYASIDKDGNRKDLVEITAKDLGGDYSVEITFPQKKWSNLPLAQAGYQWMQPSPAGPPAISHRTWLEDFAGVEQPEEEEDRIWVQVVLNSDEGKQMVMEQAARFQGDRELARIAKLKQQGLLSPGGTPTAMMPPRPGGNPPVQPGAQVQMGNPAISSLGGTMAGAMQTQAQARVVGATGQGAETSPVVNGVA